MTAESHPWRTVRPDTLKPCSATKYGSSTLVRLPNSKRFLVIGPHWPGVLVTIGVILGGTVLNIRFIHRNAFLSPTLAIFLYLVVAFFYAVTNALLLLTALSDPGIIFPADQDSRIESQPLVTSFHCKDCGLQEPAGMVMDHCHYCGYCIEKMDHHCPWMGQCIGKKNMRWFIMFNVSWVLFFLEFLFTIIIFRL